MSEFPVEDALEQQTPALPDDNDVVPQEHGDDVDPAEAYEADRVVHVDDDEWP